MSSTLAKPNEINRKWYIIDATGLPLGRIAATAATILRGKHLPIFTPNVDCGDHVIIINAKDIVLTGKKLEQKVYYRHSGYMGGIKATKYSNLMAENPELAMSLAVKRMLPANTLGRNSLTRLRVYKDANHNHQAQKPEMWTQKIK